MKLYETPSMELIRINGEVLVFLSHEEVENEGGQGVDGEAEWL